MDETSVGSPFVKKRRDSGGVDHVAEGIVLPFRRIGVWDDMKTPSVGRGKIAHPVGDAAAHSGERRLELENCPHISQEKSNAEKVCGGDDCVEIAVSTHDRRKFAFVYERSPN